MDPEGGNFVQNKKNFKTAARHISMSEGGIAANTNGIFFVTMIVLPLLT
jgi:hypothetical protein